MDSQDENNSDEIRRVGLCVRCIHGCRIPHPRGGEAYWRCALSETDPRFVKFPRLPVLRCDGFISENEGRSEK